MALSASKALKELLLRRSSSASAILAISCAFASPALCAMQSLGVAGDSGDMRVCMVQSFTTLIAMSVIVPIRNALRR